MINSSAVPSDSTTGETSKHSLREMRTIELNSALTTCIAACGTLCLLAALLSVKSGSAGGRISSHLQHPEILWLVRSFVHKGQSGTKHNDNDF